MGPVQLLVIELPDPGPQTGIKDELEWLHESDLIRLIDLLLVRKDAGGHLSVLETGELVVGEAVEAGSVVGALIGYVAPGERGAEVAADGPLPGDDGVWFADDVIPNDCAVAVALIEHQWALPLQEAIAKAGGRSLVDAWVDPADLAAIGLTPAEDAPKATA